jgi:hypothetical protein
LQRLHAAGRRLPSLLYTRDPRLLDEQQPPLAGVTRIMPRPAQPEELLEVVAQLSRALLQTGDMA